MSEFIELKKSVATKTATAIFNATGMKQNDCEFIAGTVHDMLFITELEMTKKYIELSGLDDLDIITRCLTEELTREGISIPKVRYQRIAYAIIETLTDHESMCNNCEVKE